MDGRKNAFGGMLPPKARMRLFYSILARIILIS